MNVVERKVFSREAASSAGRGGSKENNNEAGLIPRKILKATIVKDKL